MIRAATALAGALIVTGSLPAGSLTPPPGPIMPTPGPEPRIAVNATNTPGDADSVFKISQPGSYYLQANVAGVASKHGIEIAASGVTLDLNGFDVVGVAGSFDGVSAPVGNLVNISVRNGSIRSWGSSGINLLDGSNSGTSITDITASQNVLAGIRSGFGGVVTRCAAYNNPGAGIVGAAGSVVTHCSSYVNGSHGITTGSGCTISECAVRSNSGDGINIFGSCLVLHNTCSNNGVGAATGAGIHAISNDNRIEGNICSGGDFGILVDNSGNFIARNTCSGAGTNWNIAASNICLVVNATPAGGFAGNSGGAAPGSTDPNANFSY